jgi:hypothetical protein
MLKTNENSYFVEIKGFDRALKKGNKDELLNIKKTVEGDYNRGRRFY